MNAHLRHAYETGDHSSWLLGDSGYPLQPWLLTPILDAADGSPEERYTRRHCTTRSSIERCFGVLKMRFRCLLGENTLRYAPDIVGKITVACAILHNKCIDAHLEMNDIEIPEQHNDDEEIIDRNDPNDVAAEGRRIRNNLINRYFM